MSEWTPITRDDVDVYATHANGSGFSVRMKLGSGPPDPWVSAFQSPSGVEYSIALPKPSLIGDEVHFTASNEQELRYYVKYVDGAIEYANRHMETEVLPRQRAADERRAAEAAERQAQLEAMRRVAEGL